MIGAVIAGGFLVGMYFGWIAISLALFAVLTVFMVDARWSGVAALVFAAVLLGCWRAPQNPSDQIVDVPSLVGSRATITSGVVDDGRSKRFRVKVDDVGQVCAITYARAPVGRGDAVRLDLDGQATAELSDGFASYLRTQNCVGAGTVLKVTIVHHGSGPRRWLDSIRSWSAARLTRSVPGDRGALLAGLVIGDDALLSDRAGDAFLTTGTYHIVAISGANLSLLLAIVLVVTTLSARRAVRLVPLAVVWLYVLVGGSGPPTLRAGLLTTVATGGRMLGRPIDLLTLSVQVAAVQAAIWPEAIHGLSYQLSTAAMLTVLLTASGHTSDIRQHPVIATALTSLVVNIVLMPILPVPSRPSLVLAVLTNTLIAAPVAIAFALGLVSLPFFVVAPGLGKSIAVLAGEANGLTIGIVERIAGWNHGPAWLLLDIGQIPTGALIAVGAGVLLAISEDTRRLAADVLVWARHRQSTLAPILTGTMAGLMAGAVVLILRR